MQKPRLIPTVAACIVVAALAAPAAAQNLVANGSFPGGIGLWQVGGGSITMWAPLDASGSLTSGSASVTSTHPTAGVATGISQCVAASPGQTYLLSGAVRMPSAQANTGFAYLRVIFYSTPTCASNTSLNNQAVAVNLSSDHGPLDTWVTGTRSVVSAANAQGATVQFSVNKTEAGGMFQAYVDDIVLERAPDPVPRTLVIPSSASIHGAGGTFFHTDLWVKNCSHDNTISVTATYRCQAGFTCAPVSKTFSLQPRQGRILEDVVDDYFGLPETAGAIELTWDSTKGALTATTRTYTPSLPAPTNGTSVPASADGAGLTRALFLGLGNYGGDRSAGFRSNAGVYNRGAVAATVTFRLTDASNHELGTTTRTVEPNQPLQVNDIFAAAGAGDAQNRNVSLEVTSTAPVFPFVTVIDNQSGDSIWVLPVEDEAP